MFKFKTVLIVIGVFVLLRFIGQLMRAKRAVHEQEQRKKREKAVQKHREFIRQNEGRTFVIPKDSKHSKEDIEDVGYEDVK